MLLRPNVGPFGLKADMRSKFSGTVMRRDPSAMFKQKAPWGQRRYAAQ
jgi:hypothetical protein